jgi:hypothetical protein
MKLAAVLTRSLQADLQAELRDIESAVAGGTRDAGRGLRTELRRQVVYTRAPQIIRAFDEGAVIWSARGRFLAIPTENVPRKGTDGRRISPSTFGAPLRATPVRASAERAVTACGGRLARFVQQANRPAQRFPASDRARPAQRTGSDCGGDVSADAAGEAAKAA